MDLGLLNAAGGVFGTIREGYDTYRYITGDDQNLPVPAGPPGGNVPVTVAMPRYNPPKKQCRRRRRRLLTSSDLGDIARLKGIVGTGKNFENILAAAMYRSR